MDLDRPLAGCRVLDFTWVLAGPLGTRILANLGADVVKVEARQRFDPVRRAPLPPGSRDPNLGGWFNGANTGKRSIVVNLDVPEGLDVARRLALRCDAVVENFRPGVLDRIGLGYESLQRENPRAVVVHLPGSAPPGPWAQMATFGNMLAAAAGVNALSGFDDSPPSGVGIALPDFVSPYLLAGMLLAALRERDRTGRGQEITIDQLQASVSLIGVEWMQFERTGVSPGRRANRDPNCCPHGVYPAAGEDQWVAVSVETDAEWAALCALAGRPELAQDSRLGAHAARKAHEDEVDAIVGAWTAGLDKWDAADRLQVRGVAAAAVADLGDTLHRDPVLKDTYQRVRQPSSPEVEVLVEGEPIRFRGHERVLRRAPMLFEHAEDILADVLGVTGDEFAGLIGAGAIG